MDAVHRIHGHGTLSYEASTGKFITNQGHQGLGRHPKPTRISIPPTRACHVKSIRQKGNKKRGISSQPKPDNQRLGLERTTTVAPTAFTRSQLRSHRWSTLLRNSTPVSSYLVPLIKGFKMHPLPCQGSEFGQSYASSKVERKDGNKSG